MTSSIFWYDFETTGIDPRSDRPLQVAGIRTDEQLNEIGEPFNLYCKLSEDILPHPQACLVTGITPQRLAEQGVAEVEFMQRLEQQMVQPGTCTAGYNSLRFDDEVTRFSFWRNFIDPYAREWQGGNSRWDLIDLLRTAYALRPEGLVWPQQDGQVSLRLELLTAANGIEHGQAHDALADVRATIALARLLRERQPRLYQYLYDLRRKNAVQAQVRLLQPLLHVSGRFAASRHYLAVVLPLAWHPHNRNALIVCDLHQDPRPLLELDAESLRQRLYRRHSELAADELPVPLKLVHINRCPVLAPLNVLRDSDCQRLGLDLADLQQRGRQLAEQRALRQDKLAALYAEEPGFAPADVEQQLYAGFLGERDRRLVQQVREASAEQLAQGDWLFDDARLGELLFRYRARNFPDSLSQAERQRWRQFCRQRLSDPQYAAPNTSEQFERAMAQAMAQAGDAQYRLLAEWQRYAQDLQAQLAQPD